MAFEEEDQKVEEDHDAPAHHPSAPSDELFDISTTVDPSYIIGLIRKLLPIKEDNGRDSSGDPDEGLRTDLMEESDSCLSNDRVSSPKNSCKAMDDVDGFGRSYQEGKDENHSKLERPGVSAVEEVWEEYGCILWDLAANVAHAELMVQNLILEVLLTNLMVSQSMRVMEIILGIIGNLACHEVLMKHIVSKNGLVDIIVDQLLLDDTQCLNEACRLLTLGLQGSECIIWAEGLRSEHILQHVLWITENTLNPQLLEKSAGLLLAILEGRQEVAHILHPPLLKLGVSSLFINLFTFEFNQLTSERIPERYAVLDVILHAIEALSVLDGHSQEISSNKQLFQQVCNLVKFPDKVEIANSCVTAAVVIANIMSDVSDRAMEISQDLAFFQGLLDIFPFAWDDLEARSALWSIIARLLVNAQEDEMSSSSLHLYVSVLASKSDILEDDLLDNQLEGSIQEDKSKTSCGTNSNARITALRRIIDIINKWTTSKDDDDENHVMGVHRTDDVNACRLLDCCQKHIESNARSFSVD